MSRVSCGWDSGVGDAIVYGAVDGAQRGADLWWRLGLVAVTALLAAYTAGKTIVDESSARTAVAELTTD